MYSVVLADMMGFVWGYIGRELVGIQIVIAQILISASGTVTTAIGFDTLSAHGTCTVVFTLVSTTLITICSSIRTFSRLGWLIWFGFLSFFVAVFIFTVAVTQQDRPSLEMNHVLWVTELSGDPCRLLYHA